MRKMVRDFREVRVFCRVRAFEKVTVRVFGRVGVRVRVRVKFTVRFLYGSIEIWSNMLNFRHYFLC